MLTSANRDYYDLLRKAEKSKEETARKRGKALIKTMMIAQTAIDPAMGQDDNAAKNRTVVCPDPIVALDFQRGACRHVTELYFGNRSVQAIHTNFTEFVNLETLWLNNNQLSKVENLLGDSEHTYMEQPKGCFRLKKLYLSNNRLTTLLGDIQRLKFLEVLLLAENSLSDMEQISSQLAHLKILRQLDLFGNPLSEELNYRLYFVHHHPSVELFDRLTVSDTERREAVATFEKQPEKHKKKQAVFGKTLRKETEDRRNELMQSGKNNDMMSLSVRVLENRVKNLKTKKAAAEKYDQEKERAEFNRRSERRRIFQALWGKKQGKYVETPEERSMSQLYLQDGSTPVGQLIDLALEKENYERQLKEVEEQESHAVSVAATSTHTFAIGSGGAEDTPVQSPNKDADGATSVYAEEKNRIKGKIAQLTETINRRKAALVPDRIDDGLETTYTAMKQNTASEDKFHADERLIQALFTPTELDSVNKIFDSGSVSVADAEGLGRFLFNAGSGSTAGGGRTATATAARTGTGGTVGSGGKSTRSSTAGTTGAPQPVVTTQFNPRDFALHFQSHVGKGGEVDVRSALAIAGYYRPLLDMKLVFLENESNRHLKNGNGENAMVCLRKLNIVRERIELLETGVGAPGSGPRKAVGTLVEEKYRGLKEKEEAKKVADMAARRDRHKEKAPPPLPTGKLRWF